MKKHLAPGTENVPGVAGIGKAAELIYRDLAEDTERLYRLKEYFVRELSLMPHIYINGPQEYQYSTFWGKALIFQSPEPHLHGIRSGD